MQICKVPTQTLVNLITAHLHFYYFDYFLSSRAWAACGFARRQAAAIC